MALFRLGAHKYNGMLAAIKAMSEASVQAPILYQVLFDGRRRCLYTVSSYEASGHDLRYLISSSVDKKFIENSLPEKISSLMANLHQNANVLHGDFKWANILYDGEDSSVKLVDVDGARCQPKSGSYFRDVARFVIDCEEAGLSPEVINLVVLNYAKKISMTIDDVESGMRAYYKKIKKRHNRSYGKGFRLENPGSKKV